MAKSTQSANTPACIRCKHSRPFNTPRSVLVEALEDAEQKVTNLCAKRDLIPWWKITKRPTEYDVERAGWDVSLAKCAIERFDNHVMCTRFPEHVEKKNTSFCSEFSRKSRA